MNTELIEALLSRLVDVNENILESINDLRGDIKEIKDELNWINDHSFASTLLNRIDEASSNISEELNWTKDLSFAKTLINGVDNISSSLTNIDMNTSSL